MKGQKSWIETQENHDEAKNGVVQAGINFRDSSTYLEVYHHQHITGRKIRRVHKRKKIPTDAFSRIMGATETRKCRLLAAETLLVDGERLAFTNGEHNCPLVQIGI